jgi:hypothetical protein
MSAAVKTGPRVELPSVVYNRSNLNCLRRTMDNPTKTNRVFDEYLGCFGNFILVDPICRNKCALRLRCAIEQDQNTRMEVMAEMVASTEDMSIKAN